MEINNQDKSKFSRLYESIQDAFVSVNMHGLIEECNQEYLNMLGYDRSEIVNLTYQQLTPSKWHAYEEDIVRTQVIARGYSDVYAKEYQRKNGTIFPVELRTVLVRDDQGQPSVMWAIIRDITGRKTAEQALRDSEAMNRVILDASSASILLIDRAGTILTLNEAAARRFNKTTTDLIGSRALDHLPPQVAEQRLQMMERVFNCGDLIEYEDQRGEYWFESSMHPVWGDDGQVDKLVVIANDVTRKKLTLDALLDSEQRYRSLAETAEDSIFIIDKADTITYVNAYGARFLGRSIDQVVGKKRVDLFSGVHEKARSNNVQRVLRTGVPSIHESIIHTPRGSVWLSTRLVPLRDSQGKINAVLGVARDITGKKRDEKALIRARDTLEKRVARRTSELQAMQEQLRHLADKVISAQEEERRRVSRELHDDASQMLISLRYNLAALMEMNSVSENPSSRERLSNALGSVDMIIDHVRNLAHSLRPPALDVGGLHISLKEFCREFTENTKVVVEYKGENIPNLPLEISISLFRFVQEALTNVVKHAHASRVRVSLTCPGNEIILSIADNGHGFTNGNESWGTGLLGIEERINLVGGKLKVRSITGRGVALKARIPWDSLGHS